MHTKLVKIWHERLNRAQRAGNKKDNIKEVIDRFLATGGTIEQWRKEVVATYTAQYLRKTS